MHSKIIAESCRKGSPRNDTEMKKYSLKAARRRRGTPKYLHAKPLILKVDFYLYSSLSNYVSQAVIVSKKEIKLLKIGKNTEGIQKKIKGKVSSNDT